MAVDIGPVRRDGRRRWAAGPDAVGFGTLGSRSAPVRLIRDRTGPLHALFTPNAVIRVDKPVHILDEISIRVVGQGHRYFW